MGHRTDRIDPGRVEPLVHAVVEQLKHDQGHNRELCPKRRQPVLHQGGDYETSQGENSKHVMPAVNLPGKPQSQPEHSGRQERDEQSWQQPFSMELARTGVE